VLKVLRQDQVACRPNRKLLQALVVCNSNIWTNQNHFETKCYAAKAMMNAKLFVERRTKGMRIPLLIATAVSSALVKTIYIHGYPPLRR